MCKIKGFRGNGITLFTDSLNTFTEIVRTANKKGKNLVKLKINRNFAAGTKIIWHYENK